MYHNVTEITRGENQHVTTQDTGIEGHQEMSKTNCKLSVRSFKQVAWLHRTTMLPISLGNAGSGAAVVIGYSSGCSILHFDGWWRLEIVHRNACANATCLLLCRWGSAMHCSTALLTYFLNNMGLNQPLDVWSCSCKKNNVSNSLEAEVVNRVGAGPAQHLGPLHGPIKLCYLDYFQLQCFLASLNGGFMSVSSILNAAPHQRNFTFCMKPLGKRRKEFHHGETFGHSFTCVGNCVKPPLRHK
jgi:hypothetical protein